MFLVHWSRRRILLLWLGGLALQLALRVAPARWALSNVSTTRAQWENLRARWTIAERADSISRAAQRAKGASAVGPAGDSVFAVVSMPSGRPVSPPVQRERTVGVMLFDVLYLGGIPLILCILTGLWWWRRHARLA